MGSNVSITCYGGVGEIGGNKVLLEDGDTRIWLDFGMSFGRYQDFFEEFMGPRGIHTGVEDFVELKLIPGEESFEEESDVRGLYAPDLLELSDREATDPAFDAVLLSHAHDDHAKYISLLNPDIQVYMGETTLRIREALEEMATAGVDNRICRYTERDENGKRNGDDVERNINTFTNGNSFTIGSVEVEPIHVDHSIPGAYGFILHTSEGSVVYTGDLRLHGRNSFKTKEFIQRAAEVNPVNVLSEGTRITDTEKVGESEQKVRDEMVLAAKGTDGLVVVDYSYKDLDRFTTLVQVAQETGRRVVVGPKAAYLYQVYAEHIDGAPVMDDVLFHLKKKSRPYKWEKPFYDSEAGLTAEEIGKQQGELLLAFNQWKLNELIDIQPTNAAYIRSMSEPYNEEMAIDEERVKNWINYYNMEWVRTHCSGHAPGQDLKQVVRDINAETIVPIHTEHPDAFSDLGNVEKPEQGSAVTI